MTSVAELFDAAGVRHSGAVRWGQIPDEGGPGVYVIATTERADENGGLDLAQLDRDAITELLRVRPEASVDGVAATHASLSTRLQEMWVRGEPAVYIGLAGTSVRARVEQFYRTKIGARAPHSGGWPLKMLESELWVHYGPAVDPDAAEAAMLRHFEANVPQASRATLVDQITVLPFANLTHPRGRRKKHGLSGVRAQRAAVAARPGATSSREALRGAGVSPADATSDESALGWTQNVTAADLKQGQLRVPKASKRIFPAGRGNVSVQVGDVVIEAHWDPRVGVDRERSGVLRIPRHVLSSLAPGGPRAIRRAADGIFVLEPPNGES